MSPFSSRGPLGSYSPGSCGNRSESPGEAPFGGLLDGSDVVHCSPLKPKYLYRVSFDGSFGWYIMSSWFPLSKESTSKSMNIIVSPFSVSSYISKSIVANGCGSWSCVCVR